MGQSSSEEGLGCWLLGGPCSPGPPGTKCYWKVITWRWGEALQSLFVAVVPMSPEPEALSFFSHIVILLLHPSTPTLILNPDVAGRSWMRKGSMYLGTWVRKSDLEHLSWSWFAAKASWEGGPGRREGKLGVFLQAGQPTSLCHQVEGKTWKVIKLINQQTCKISHNRCPSYRTRLQIAVYCTDSFMLFHRLKFFTMQRYANHIGK